MSPKAGRLRQHRNYGLSRISVNKTVTEFNETERWKIRLQIKLDLLSNCYYPHNLESIYFRIQLFSYNDCLTVWRQ